LYCITPIVVWYRWRGGAGRNGDRWGKGGKKNLRAKKNLSV
jgi:hypothetical protein